MHPASRCRYAGTTGTNLYFQTPQPKFYPPQEGSNFVPQRVSDFRHRACVPRPTPRGVPINHISPNRIRTRIIHQGILLKYLQGYDQEETNYVVNVLTQGFCFMFRL